VSITETRGNVSTVRHDKLFMLVGSTGYRIQISGDLRSFTWYDFSAKHFVCNCLSLIQTRAEAYI